RTQNLTCKAGNHEPTASQMVFVFTHSCSLTDRETLKYLHYPPCTTPTNLKQVNSNPLTHTSSPHNTN
ncbi:MAG: hypothetical protein ACK55Z_04065, partial [bacterium]